MCGMYPARVVLTVVGRVGIGSCDIGRIGVGDGGFVIDGVIGGCGSVGRGGGASG